MAKKPPSGRKKTKPRRAKNVSGSWSLSPWLRRRLLLAALVASTIWLGVLVTRHLAREAYANQVFSIDPEQIGLIGLPDDLPSAWRQDLERAVSRLRNQGRLMVFDDSSLARVEETLAEIPWIERVDAVERRFPDGLDAVLQVRVPVAVVTDDVSDLRAGGRWAWVDRHGILLPPPGPPDHPDWKKVPVVLTRELPRRLPPYGELLRDRGVIAGAATARRFAEVLDTQDELDLLYIDASEHARIDGVTSRLTREKSEIELHFRRLKAANEKLFLVSWGSPEPYPGYLPPEGRPTFEHRWNLLMRAGRDHPGYATLAQLNVRFGQFIIKREG